MSPEFAVDLVSQMVWVVVSLVALIVVPSLLVGLVVAIFQAVTQINEQTLSFLPRFITTFAVLVIGGHWMLQKITDLFNQIFHMIPTSIG